MAFFCCSSATGAKVIAIISLISSVVILVGFGGLCILSAVRIERMNTTEEVVFMANALYGRNTVLNSMVIQPKNITVDEETYYRKDFVDFLHKTIDYLGYNFLAVYTFVAVYNLIASIELLQGVRNKNYWRCNIWLKWFLGSLIASTLSSLLLVIFISNNVFTKLIQFSIGWAISLYFMYVVYEFMQEISREDEKDDQKK
ncbi:uncharacterized protein LOC110863598 [Folsomia candida]|uniref:Uncharacterized protein n=1 Tax=Folsomia candida TaxID=158441 RepID=A0A226EYR4_FOLCA|nr:uncharacterized protein LOC110863598 [Folsomia candida]OXA62254.1 hypothetical protein Fcan01_03178 [Folsomia candida]